MFEIIKDGIQTAAEWLFGAIKTLFLSFFEQLRNLGQTVMEAMLSAWGGYMPDVAGQLADQTTLLGQINFFFPLEETVGYATALAGLWIGVVVYKLIKSWFSSASS